MRIATWEKAAITVLVGGCALIRHKLPAKIEVGEAVLLAAVLLLVQGLVRDLVGQRIARAQAAGPLARITCVCAESTIGVGLIVAGALLVLAWSPIVLRTPAVTWPIAVAIVMVFGFATRHLVIDWRARRLRWEPNHAGVVVWKNG